MRNRALSLMIACSLLLTPTITFAKEGVDGPAVQVSQEKINEIDGSETEEINNLEADKIEGSDTDEIKPTEFNEIRVLEGDEPEVVVDESEDSNVEEVIIEEDIFVENTGLNTFISSDGLVKRISGSNRINTSVELSKFLREKSDVVILVDSKGYSDALSGSVLTQGKYPILLVDGTMSTSVLNEIIRLEATQAIILGGTSAIPSTVEAELENIGLSPEMIVRIAGKDRYETSFEIAQHSRKENIVFASGENFPDALASASFAKSVNANLVLMGKEFNPQHQILLQDSLQNYVIGGKAAINPELIPAKTTVIAGENRYQTSTIIAETLRKDFVVVASGENFPDALSIAPLSMGLDAPVILTGSKALPKDTLSYLTKNRESIKKVLVVGGESAIDPLVYKNIEEIIKTGKIQTFPPKDVSLFKNNDYVMALRDTTLSGNITVLAGKVAKVIAITGETVELEYNGTKGMAIIEDYSKNTILNKNTKVPYISQVKPLYAPVGCEGVALLMGLKGKGYAKNTTTKQFLDNMPKHASNPRKGYVGSPYRPTESLRTTINPSPLAQYGAKYGNVANMEGKSMDDIIMELDNGNPVVVYVTLYWEKAYYKNYSIEGNTESWLRNNHAVLLTGYNKNTKEFYVSDPYNMKRGSSKTYPNYEYTKSRRIVEPLYDIRKFAVVVR